MQINRFNSSLLERKLSSQHDAVQPDSADTPAQFLRPRPPQAQPTGGADGPITAGRNSSDSLNKLRHSRGPLLSDLQSALHHQHGQEHDQQHAQEKGGVQAPQAAARPASPCPLSPSRPGSSTGASSRWVYVVAHWGRAHATWAHGCSDWRARTNKTHDP